LSAENQEEGWVSMKVELWLREREGPMQSEESWVCGVFFSE